MREGGMPKKTTPLESDLALWGERMRLSYREREAMQADIIAAMPAEPLDFAWWDRVCRLATQGATASFSTGLLFPKAVFAPLSSTFFLRL